MTFLLLCYHSIASCICKGDISATAIYLSSLEVYFTSICRSA